MQFWWDGKHVYNKIMRKGYNKIMWKGCFLLFFCLPALVVVLEGASYTVSESVEAVEICITAVGTSTPCTSTQSLQVTFSTTDECAGIIILFTQYR